MHAPYKEAIDFLQKIVHVKVICSWSSLQRLTPERKKNNKKNFCQPAAINASQARMNRLPKKIFTRTLPFIRSAWLPKQRYHHRGSILIHHQRLTNKNEIYIPKNLNRCTFILSAALDSYHTKKNRQQLQDRRKCFDQSPPAPYKYK